MLIFLRKVLLVDNTETNINKYEMTDKYKNLLY